MNTNGAIMTIFEIWFTAQMAGYFNSPKSQTVTSYGQISTDGAAIEDEEGPKSVAEFVQPKWLAQIAHMGYHFVPWLN